MDPNAFIKKHAGRMSARVMAMTLGLTEKSVHHRAQAMGVSLRRYGQYHPGAKHSDEVVRAAQVLYQHGGIPPSKIKTLLAGLSETSESTIWAWVDGRNR